MNQYNQIKENQAKNCREKKKKNRIKDKWKDTSFSAAPALQAAIDTANIALAPRSPFISKD